MTWFHCHIPPSWLARPQLEKVAGSTFSDLTKVGLSSDITNGKVFYAINELGYRNREFQKTYNSAIISLGMSCSFGLGVEYEKLYSTIVEKEIATPVLNFSIPGASSDTVARVASCIIPYWSKHAINLKVVVGWPYSLRRELFLDEFKASINFQNEPPIKEYFKLLDDTANEYNQEKNQLLIRMLCTAYKIPLYEIPNELYLDLDIDRAEDGFHPGPVWHRTVAEWFLAQSK